MQYFDEGIIEKTLIKKLKVLNPKNPNLNEYAKASAQIIIRKKRVGEIQEKGFSSNVLDALQKALKEINNENIATESSVNAVR